MYDEAQININTPDKYKAYGWAYGKIEMNSAANVVNISACRVSDIYGSDSIFYGAQHGKRSPP